MKAVVKANMRTINFIESMQLTGLLFLILVSIQLILHSQLASIAFLLAGSSGTLDIVLLNVPTGRGEVAQFAAGHYMLWDMLNGEIGHYICSICCSEQATKQIVIVNLQKSALTKESPFSCTRKLPEGPHFLWWVTQVSIYNVNSFNFQS